MSNDITETFKMIFSSWNLELQLTWFMIPIPFLPFFPPFLSLFSCLVETRLKPWRDLWYLKLIFLFVLMFCHKQSCPSFCKTAKTTAIYINFQSQTIRVFIFHWVKVSKFFRNYSEGYLRFWFNFLGKKGDKLFSKCDWRCKTCRWLSILSNK